MMNRKVGARRRPDRARVFGVAGRSARREARRRAARHRIAVYQLVPRRYPTVGILLLSTLVGVAAYRLGYPPVPAAFTTAGILTAIHVTVRHPQAVATLLVLAGWTPVAAMLARLYAAATATGRAEMFLAVLTSGLLVAVVAHRTSRGRPWLTVLLALAASSVFGPLLAAAAPSTGMLGGLTVAGIILGLRAGWWTGLVDWVDTVRDRLTGGGGMTGAEQAARWAAGADGEERTAALLADLDRRYAVFHDLALPGTRANVDHLVIGPGGVFLVDSKNYRGAVREDPTVGLVHNSRPLADVFATVLAERARVAVELRLPPADIHPLVVVHTAVLPGPRTPTAVVDDTGATLGTVVVLAPTGLLAEITAGGERLPARHVARLVRRTRHRLVTYPARIPTRPAGPLPPLRPAAGLVVLDPTGQPRPLHTATPIPAGRDASPHGAVRFGQRVSVLTDEGVFTGLRVAGQAWQDDDGTVIVPLCTDADWAQAIAGGTPPDTYPYPATSVVPL